MLLIINGWVIHKTRALLAWLLFIISNLVSLQVNEFNTSTLGRAMGLSNNPANNDKSHCNIFNHFSPRGCRSRC